MRPSPLPKDTPETWTPPSPWPYSTAWTDTIRSLNASSLVREAVLMLEMLSETASSHLRCASMPEPAMLIASKRAMSGRLQRAAQQGVLAVEGIERQLVAQAGLGGDDRLAVQVDVVAVRVGRLQRAGDGAPRDGRGLAVADLGLERGLEVGAAGQEAGRVDVGDVVGGDPLTLGQPREGAVQRRHGAVLDQHGTRRRSAVQDAAHIRGTSGYAAAHASGDACGGSADPWRDVALRAHPSSAPRRRQVTR